MPPPRAEIPRPEPPPPPPKNPPPHPAASPIPRQPARLARQPIALPHPQQRAAPPLALAPRRSSARLATESTPREISSHNSRPKTNTLRPRQLLRGSGNLLLRAGSTPSHAVGTGPALRDPPVASPSPPPRASHGRGAVCCAPACQDASLARHPGLRLAAARFALHP